MKMLSHLLLCASLGLPLSTGAAPAQEVVEIGDTPLLVYFNDSSCPSCQSFDGLVSHADTWSQIEERYVIVILDINDTAGRACAEIFHIDESPALVIADRNGVVLYRAANEVTIEDIDRILSPHPAWETEVNTIDHVIPPVTTAMDRPAASTVSLVSMTPTPINSTNAIEIKLESALASCPNAATIREKALLHLNTAEYSDAPPVNVAPIADISSSYTTSESHNTLASETATRGKWKYAIQLGFFSTDDNASKLVSNANSCGFENVRSEPTDRNGQMYFRVLSGSYSTLRDAQAGLASATVKGFNAAIHRWQ